MDKKPEIIELKEYISKCFDRNHIPDKTGELLWHIYKNQVSVDFPSPKTDGMWQLTSQGWVGYIPLSKDLHIALHPKVDLSNLFGMIAYAYRLKSLKFLDDLMSCQSLEKFYEELAKVLALRVLDRGRKGFYRAYLHETERLPYIRGRLDINKIIREPWEVKLKCHYEEHTPDVEENQILAWTLSRIARSGMCTERVLPTVRCAYRSLQGFTSLIPHRPKDCIGRLYNRLNEDYHPMHAICRFFLEHSGPTHEIGDKTMLPFLVNMERLYELFVSEWLKVHLPEDFRLKYQDKVAIGQEGMLYFDIDLVLYDTLTDEVRYVLDTKYKAPDKPSTDDLAQVVAYAEAKDCKEAILIYPIALEKSLDEKIGDIRVRSLTFSLDDDLEKAGKEFLKSLFQKSCYIE